MSNQRIPSVPLISAPFANGDNGHATVVVDGESLTIEQLVMVAAQGAKVCLTDRPEVLRRMEASCRYVEKAVAAGRPIYGVTTGFGGMANIAIPKEEVAELQNN